MWIWVAAAFLAGAFFGFLLASLLAAAKRGDEAAEARPGSGDVVSGPQDLERLGIPILGVIPELGGSDEAAAAREPGI